MAERPGATRRVLLAFLMSLAGSTAFVVAYARDAGPQWQGAALAVAIGGLGVGLAHWSRGLMPQGPFVEEREEVRPATDEQQAAARAFAAGGQAIGRRGVLGGALVLSAVGLAAAVLSPLRSLVVGTRPAEALRRTEWSPGARLVDADGVAVRAVDLEVGSVQTVFPEGAPRSVSAQTVLVRVGPGELRPTAGREDWAPEGHLAYSKVCTHAGCPVGLYQEQNHTLLCPCHQAAFDVLDAARPVFGPAARPLPQLPLGIDEEGYLVARADFSEPIGPGFWSLED